MQLGDTLWDIGDTPIKCLFKLYNIFIDLLSSVAQIQYIHNGLLRWLYLFRTSFIVGVSFKRNPLKYQTCSIHINMTYAV